MRRDVVDRGQPASLPAVDLVALVLVPLLHVMLRRAILPEGTGTKMVPGTTALIEADDLDDEDVRSAALD